MPAVGCVSSARRAYVRPGCAATGRTEAYPLAAGAVEHEPVRPL